LPFFLRASFPVPLSRFRCCPPLFCPCLCLAFQRFGVTNTVLLRPTTGEFSLEILSRLLRVTPLGTEVFLVTVLLDPNLFFFMVNFFFAPCSHPFPSARPPYPSLFLPQYAVSYCRDFFLINTNCSPWIQLRLFCGVEKSVLS